MIKKIIKYFVLTICIFAVVTPVPILAASQTIVSIESTTSGVQPRIVGWIYKEVDGKLYKRLYDHHNNEWIGDWILVG